MTLPYDVARCPGIGSAEEGFFEDCETCLRRLSPGADSRPQVYMAPPAVIAFFCPYQIESTP
jgi:hypothetical protein